jgi:histidyl-tRNA synthetase
LSHATQFNQLGVEFVGSDSIIDDVEAIACAHHVLSAIGCTSQLRLLVNTLGTSLDRSCYREHLAQHLAANVSSLSPDSLLRLQRGAVLRVLDSKDAADAAVISSAPCMSASLSRDSEERFQAVLHGLKLLGVPFHVDRRLVRGLDYYTSTAFEFVVGEGRACNAVLAGGRYDLGQQLQRGGGGARLPAIGWALGVDRFLALFPPQPPPTPRVITVIAGPGSSVASASAAPSADGSWTAEHRAALLACTQLREQGLPAVLDCDGGNLKKAMARASKYVLSSLHLDRLPPPRSRISGAAALCALLSVKTSWRETRLPFAACRCAMMRAPDLPISRAAAVDMHVTSWP